MIFVCSRQAPRLDSVGDLQTSPDPLSVPVIEDRVDGRREIGAVPGRDDDETVAPGANSPVQRPILRAEHVQRVVRVLEFDERLGVPP
jgi:hypothetical protein